MATWEEIFVAVAPSLAFYIALEMTRFDSKYVIQDTAILNASLMVPTVYFCVQKQIFPLPFAFFMLYTLLLGIIFSKYQISKKSNAILITGGNVLLLLYFVFSIYEFSPLLLLFGNLLLLVLGLLCLCSGAILEAIEMRVRKSNV